MKKEILDEIEKYSEEALINSIANPFFAIGDVTYYKEDLLVVYKIKRLLLNGIIDENKYYYLMELYYKKLLLEEKLSFSDDEILYNELNKVNIELGIYYLSTEELALNNLIDDSIKYKNKTRILK